MKTKIIQITIPARYKYKVRQPWGAVELHVKKPQIHDNGPGDEYWDKTREDYIQIDFGKMADCPEWKASLEKI